MSTASDEGDREYHGDVQGRDGGEAPGKRIDEGAVGDRPEGVGDAVAGGEIVEGGDHLVGEIVRSSTDT